jgi:hypothetical protein
MMLSKIGITASSDNVKHGGNPSLAIAVMTEVFKSISSRTMDPLSGSSPAPVIFSQPMSFNTFSRSAASIDTRILETSLSVSFDARSLPMSLKSSVSESKHADLVSAEAMIARDGIGRYSPMHRRIESGR